MGFLTSLFKSSAAPQLERLPAGSFTVDREGRVVTSTLPLSFGEERARKIGRTVIAAINAARAAQLTVTQLSVHYGGLKITAREQRGGAMIFLAPIR